MRLAKRWSIGLIFVFVLGSMAGLSLLSERQAAAALLAATPTTPSDNITTTPSPDGRWTAIANTTVGSLDLQGPDGQTVNIFPASSTVNTLAWSPDGQTLLVVRTGWVFSQPEGTGVSSSDPIEIWQVGLKDDKPTTPARLYQSSTPPADGPQQIVFGHWSPDSRYVLFWEGILSASILADGLPLSVLEVSSGQVSPLAGIALLNPRYQSWSPDSSAVAVTAGGYRSAQVVKWLTVWETASDQATTVISQTEQIPGIVAWSPQGDLIAYAAVSANQTGDEWADLMTLDNPAIAGRRIYLLNPATGQSHRLNQAGSYQDAPLWSNDGSILHYVERSSNKVLLMSADPTTGRAEPVPGASQPIDLDEAFPSDGYYGQSNWDTLLAQRPNAEQAAGAAVAATPDPADLELVRFIFKKHPPVLGSLLDDFLKKVEAGQYSDFTVQEADLTGDGQPELAVSGSAERLFLFVAILSRDPAGEPHELYYTENFEGVYQAEIRASIDGRRVTADFLTSSGGTGYRETTWEQHWIECQNKTCALVWSAPLLMAQRNVQWTTERQYAVTGVEQPDPQTIRLNTSRFGLKNLPTLAAGAPPGTARRVVGPDTLAVYQRTGRGEVYQLVSQSQLSPGQEIAGEFDFESEETRRLLETAISQPFIQTDGSFDSNGFLEKQATLWGLPRPDQPESPGWGAAWRPLDIAAQTGTTTELGDWVAGLIGGFDTTQCRLTVLHHTKGSFDRAGRRDVPCTANLTRLAWADVTGDGQDELLLLTIPPDVESAGQVQRLHVYTVTDNKLAELTTLDGVINGEDGLGIRWESTADGFQVEAGLPLLDPDADPGFDELRLEREFQLYRWDARGKDFKAVK